MLVNILIKRIIIIQNPVSFLPINDRRITESSRQSRYQGEYIIVHPPILITESYLLLFFNSKLDMHSDLKYLR